MSYYKQLGNLATKSNQIERDNYEYFNVKDGLRNRDGSGVLVGLTNVSSVIGYEKVDEELLPLEGRLFYRGIDVADLVNSLEKEERYGYEETAFLLLFGRLPSTEETTHFNEVIGKMRNLPLNFSRDVLQTFRTPDITNALARSVLTFYGMDKKPDDLSLPNQIRQGMSLIAKMNTLVPYAYHSIRHGFFNKSLIIHTPDTNLSAAQNFLRLMRNNMEYTEEEARTLDILLLLHADHGGGNNSTFTTRVVSSTNTDTYSAIAASLGSLKGPLHGGANVRALKMMEYIIESVGKTPTDDELRALLFQILKGEVYDKAGKIYGIGHAVYTLSDPRTRILKKYAEKMAILKNRQEEFQIFKQVEELAPQVLKDFKNNPDFVASANVDFYSGFIFSCLEIPTEVYTPMFAMARIAGWCAHRIEVMTNRVKIMRPAYKALKPRQLQYVPLAERKPVMEAKQVTKTKSGKCH